jgi:hypothetical protein
MMLPTENDPLTTAAAKARFVVPPTLAAIHCLLHQRCSMFSRELETVAYSIYNWQRSDHSIDEVNASKATRSIGHGKK